MSDGKSNTGIDCKSAKTSGLTVASALVILSTVIVSASLWYWHGRSVSIEKPWTGEKVASLSFAPFQPGQSPLDKKFPDRTDVDRDLAVVSNITKSVRTYSSSEGAEHVPELAARHGLKVIQSAWLSTKPAYNRREISALIARANAWPDTVTKVIVGNEVLLRKDLGAAELTEHLRKVRNSVRQPVSYADVWEMWLKHPELGKEVDFITVHLLPYWEDQPIPVANSVEHMEMIYQRLQNAFPGKPIFIGEVGWPDAGRTREGAIPGRVEQARFLNAFCNLATERGWDYNIIEAFDQPWKSRMEGAVGGHWGLFDTRRQQKFVFGQQISANPHWTVFFIASQLLTLVLALATLRRNGFDGWRTAVWIVSASVTANLLFYGAWREYWQNCLWQDWIPGFFMLGLQAGWGWLQLADYKTMLGINTENRSMERRARIVRKLWIFFSVMAIYLTAMLAINGRYRNFPVGWFLLPAFGYWIGAAIGSTVPYDRYPPVTYQMKTRLHRIEYWSAALLVISGCTLIFTETTANREGMFLVLELFLMAGANIAIARQRYRRLIQAST